MKREKETDISFLGKVILFFRSRREKHSLIRLPEKIISKQKGLAGYDSEKSPAEAKMAFGFGMA